MSLGHESLGEKKCERPSSTPRGSVAQPLSGSTAALLHLQRLAGNRAVASLVTATRPPTVTVQRQDKNIGLGFSELYGLQDDAFGKKSKNQDNLAKFRKAVRAEGPGAFAKGVASQRVSGAIQQAFTAGIRQAMAESLKIQQNLAGFTENQITHARNHPPILTDQEVQIAEANFPGYKGLPRNDAQLWSAMGFGPTAGSWGKDLAAISVWELSHMLHNTHLFDKTEFHYYDATDTAPRTAKLTLQELKDKNVILNELDLKELSELGIDLKSEEQGWFAWLFGSCLPGGASSD